MVVGKDVVETSQVNQYNLASIEIFIKINS